MATDREATGDELAVALAGLLAPARARLRRRRRGDRLVGRPPAHRRVRAAVRALPRGLAAPWSARPCQPGCPSGSRTRTRSGRTASSTRWPPTSATAAPCIVVDFGTAINYDAVSAEGEYLGGVISPGVEISLEALSDARRPPPEGRPRAAARGHRPLDPGGHPVGRRLRLRRPGGRHRRAACARSSARRPRRSPRAAGRLDRAVLRADRRGGRPAHAHRAAADLGAQPGVTAGSNVAVGALAHRPLDPRRALELPNRLVLAPAGRHRQLVRAPAGQAPRRRASWCPRWSRASGSSTATSARSREFLRIHPDEHPVVDPAVRPRRRT